MNSLRSLKGILTGFFLHSFIGSANYARSIVVAKEDFEETLPHLVLHHHLSNISGWACWYDTLSTQSHDYFTDYIRGDTRPFSILLRADFPTDFLCK
jgi:hypothetical protein